MSNYADDEDDTAFMPEPKRGDDTLQPESADERELRLLREQDAAIRAIVGADERCVFVRGDHLVCDAEEIRHTPEHPDYGHEFQPETTLSAVERMADMVMPEWMRHDAITISDAMRNGCVCDGMPHETDAKERLVRLLDVLRSYVRVSDLANGVANGR